MGIPDFTMVRMSPDIIAIGSDPISIVQYPSFTLAFYINYNKR